MDARLSAEQVADLRRSPNRPAKDVARDLGIGKDEAAEVLGQVETLTPLWAGREATGLVLGVGGFLIFLVTLLVYSGNASGGFLFDDVHSINTSQVASLRVWMRQNVRPDDPARHKLSNLGEGLSRTLNELFAYNRFRVVTYATFAWEDYYYDEGPDQTLRNGGLTSANPAAPEPHVHYFNNAVHALNGVWALLLAYLTFTAPAFQRSQRALRYPAAGALLVGVVFSLHPLQTQAVTYISQRAECLGTFFALGCLTSLIWARRRSQEVGSAQGKPFLTVLVWGAVLLAAGLLIVAAAKGALAFATGVKVLGFLIALAVAATVYLVKQGFDESLHAWAVGIGFSCFVLGLETKEIVAVVPMIILLWEIVFGREPGAPREAASAVAQAEAEAPEAEAPEAEAPEAEAPEAEAPSLLPEGPALLQKVWAWRALRGFARRPTLLYHAPWVGGVLLVFLAFPLVGGANFRAQFLASRGVDMGGRQAVKITPLNYLLTQANVAHSYLRLAAIPGGQNVDHDYPLALDPPLGQSPTGPLTERLGDFAKPIAPPPLSSPLTTLLSLSLLGGAVVLALLFGGRARLPAFALGFGLLVLAPSSSLVVLADVIFEHRFYLPLLGCALVLPSLLERAAGRIAGLDQRTAVMVLLPLLALLGGYLVHERNAVWQNNLSLWGDVTTKSPGKPRGWVNLGLFWQKVETHVVTFRTPAGQLAEQRCAPVQLPGGEDLLLLQYAYQVGTPQILPLNTVTSIRVFDELKDAPQDAQRCYRSAIDIEPYGKALNNLAILSVYRYQHLAQERQVIRQALLPRFQERRDSPRIQACEARLDAIEPLLDAAAAEAERCLLTKIAMGETDFFTYNNLGGLYSMTSRHGDSVYYLEAALRLPDHEELTWAGLGEAQEKWGLTRHLISLSYGTNKVGVDHWAALARQSWTKALEAYQTFLQKQPNAPQAAYVRKSVERIQGWLAGRGLPDERTKIPRTATFE